jgi:hypothetical protein
MDPTLYRLALFAQVVGAIGTFIGVSMRRPSIG